MNTQEVLWYKDAVFYELHVRTFFDSNDDGMGDFKGATMKLDYLQSLGVDCIWLLPFYPSPLKDDGYDVADFYNIHPELGTLDDFKEFIAEAHARGMKVIADMVFNHVSDSHPWFQQAVANVESPKHDYFVWSDNPELYDNVRVIFIDTEPSNWTYHNGVKKYYWHRFFRHQPDLNFDNAEVREEMKNVVRFWLDLGLDGFRCDAVPYLFEREHTSCENLPETHDYFKEVRKMVDTEYPGRILLAEANQWPTDAIPYFGQGDEFHMAFNFPLMPRIYLALAKEHSQPISDIVQKTIDIPETAQWATFLRNHDELTLEMVTDEERDFLWAEYAKSPKMRLNLGIRRRLAPLVDGDRLTMEFLHGLYFSLPGSPVIYYGDELGMGDNISLGDRNGVRTPMQWSSDLNAGFSDADPDDLYLPPIRKPSYHYRTFNVKTQERTQSSMLNWVRNLISVRKQSSAFGRGSIDILEVSNNKMFAFIRSYKKESILCIFNLSKTSQFVTLDLSKYKGKTPVDMMGGGEFMKITDNPYVITLTGRRFMWLKLT